MATWDVGAGKSCETIKDALSCANDGDTIIVNAGDYTGESTITINKSITIKAANAATTAADAEKAIIDNIVINGGSDGDLLTVEIDGLQINANTKNDGEQSHGVFLGTLWTESVTIKNCNIDLTKGQSEGSGIKMSLGTDDRTETIVIENNIITGSAENTISLIHIGDKKNLESLSVKGNTLSGCNSHGMNFDFEEATDYSIEIDNNKVSVCGRDGIKLAGLKNADSTVAITGNEVANVNNDRCDADDAAIALRGSGELKKVTVTGNEVSNAQVGVYFDSGVVNDGVGDKATDITVSNNNIAVVEKHAPGVGETPAVSGVPDFVPADANTVIECEKLTNIMVDDDFTAKDGEIVTVNGKNYIMGKNAFATINGALGEIKKSSDGDAKYTILLNGSFAEDVIIENYTGSWKTENNENEPDITFMKAAGAATAAITGKVQIGYTTSPNDKTHKNAWNGDVCFDSITFDYTKTTDNENRFEILCFGKNNKLDIIDCTFNGPGMINADYNGGQPWENNGDPDGNNAGNLFCTPWHAATDSWQGVLTVKGTTFNDGNINFWRNAANWGFEDCHFNNAPVTFLGNPAADSYEFKNCAFSMNLDKVNEKIAAYLIGATNNANNISLGEGCKMTMTGTAKGEASYIYLSTPNNNYSTESDGRNYKVASDRTKVYFDVNDPTTYLTDEDGKHYVQADNGEKLYIDPNAVKVDFSNVKVEGKIPENVDFLTNLSMHETDQKFPEELNITNNFNAQNLSGVTAEDVKGAANVEITNTLEDGTTQKITTDGEGVVNESLTNLDKVLYLNGESYTEDLEYKAIKAASGTSQITDADVTVGGLQVGTFEKDENISGSATLELSGVNVNITNNNQGVNGSVWIGDYYNEDIDDYTNERSGNYTLILSNGSTIRSETAYEENVGGVAIRCDGILQITSGSSFYAQWVPIRGKVKVTDEDSIFRVISGNMYGKDASITVLNDGTFEIAHTCGSCSSNTHDAGSTFIVGDNEGENAGKIIAGTDTEKGGIVKIGVADTLKVNALGVVEVKNGGQILGAEAKEMPNGTTYYSNLEINNGSVLVNGGTVDVGKITNDGTFKVTGKDASTVKAAITGNALQLENGVLENSEIGGTVNVYGTNNTINDSTVSGNVHVNWANEKVDGVWTGVANTNIALSLDNATTGIVYVGSDVKGYSGALTVGSSNNISIYNRVYGTTKITGSDNVINYINAKGSISIANAKNTKITAMVAEGGVIDITDSDIDFAIDSSNDIELKAKTAMTVTNSDLDIQHITIDATSELKLFGSTVEMFGVYDYSKDLIANNGTITMDAASMITSDAITGAGTITIDADGFSGTKKVIDLAGTSSLEGKVTLVNGEGITAVYGEDGDVTITDASKDFLYVNSAWAGKNAGDEIEAGKVIGVNAFANSKDALAAANAEGGEVTINVTGMGSDMVDGYTAKLNNAGTYTITGGTGKGADLYGVTVQNSEAKLVFDNASFGIGKLYVSAAGASLTVTDSIIGTTQTDYAGHKGWLTANQGSMSFDNSIVGINFENFTDEEIKAMPRSASDVKAAVADGTYKYWAFGSDNSGPHMGTADEISVTDSTLSATWISLIDRAEMSLDNSVLYYGAAISIGAGRVDETLGSYNSNESGWDAQIWWGPVASKDGFREGEVATMNITDSIVRNIGSGNGNEGAHVQVGGSVTYGSTPVVGQDFAGVLNLKNSEFYITPYDADGNAIAREYDFMAVKDNGTVNVEDSTLVTAKVINDGTVNVTGESTLDIAAATGNAIVLTDGAVLTDSKLFSADYTVGSAELLVAGNVVMNGTYEGNLTRVSGANAKLTINGTYTATNGGYYQLTVGGTSNWHMDHYYNGSYADGGALVVSKDASVTVDCLSIVANGSASIAGNVTVESQFELSNGGISNAQAGKLTVESGASVAGAVYSDIYGELTVKGSLNAEQTEANNAAFTVHKGGSVVLNGGTMEVNGLSVTNNGTITIQGASTVNAKVAGKGAVVLDWWATLGGDLKLTGDAALKLNGYASLADDAAIDGKLVDGVLMVKGSNNSIKLVDGSTTVLQLADGTKLDAATDFLADAKIQGEWWGMTFTVDDAVLAGNTVAAGAFMNITNADTFIEVDADITQIKTINTFTVEKLGDMYYYIDNKKTEDAGDDVTMLITATSSGFDITEMKKPDDNTGAGTVTPETEPVATDLNSMYIDKATTALANSNIEMAAGYTSISTGNGAWSEDKDDNMEVAFGSIQKDEKGGINDIYIGSNVDMDINGNIESMGNVSVGANSTLDVRDAMKGQNNGQSVYVGYNAGLTAENIDLKGGWNSLTVDYEGDLDVEHDVMNVASLGIYGKEATIGGDFIAPLYNSNIDVGYMSSLSIEGNIDNGVDNGTYECLGTGTYISVGYDAEFSAANIYGLSGMYADAKSVVKVVDYINGTMVDGDIYGTMYGNSIYVGGESFSAGNIDLKGGWNSFATGYMTTAEVKGNIENVASISTGWDSALTVTGYISGVQSLAVEGNWGTDVKFSVAGAVTAADWANFYIGSYVDADFKAGITFGDTYDSLSIGSYSTVEVTGNIDKADNIYVGWDSALTVTGNISGVQSLAVEGNWGTDVKFSVAGAVTAADWANFYIGSYVGAEFKSGITFGDTYDSLNIGSYSTVEVTGNIDNADNIYVGWDSALTVTGDITGVQSLAVEGGTDGKFDANDITAGDWAYHYIGSYVTANINSITYGDTYDSLSIGSYSDVEVDGDILNADNIYVGWDSNMYVTGDITGVQSLNVAGGTNVEFKANDITAGDWAYHYIGSYVTANINSITYGDTYDSLNIGSYSDVEVDGDILNADNIYVGWDSKMYVDGDIIGVQSLAVEGNWDKEVEFTVGDVTAADWANFYIGSYVNASIDSITYGDTYDSLSIGSYSDVVVTGNIDKVDNIYVGNNTDVNVGSVSGVQSLNIAGSWDAADRVEVDITTLNVANTGSYVNFGSNVDAVIDTATFGAGYDTMNIGYKSTVEIGSGSAVDFSELDALYMDATAVLEVKNGKDADVDLSDVGGWWQDATIFDMAGALNLSGETGSVYGNEWDLYSFTTTENTAWKISGDGLKLAIYQLNDDGELTYKDDFSAGQLIAFGSDNSKHDFEAGDYLLAVSVNGADFDKNDKTNNEYSFSITTFTIS